LFVANKAGLLSKVSEVATEIAKNCPLTPPPQGTPANIRTYLTFLKKTSIIDLHFAADNENLYSPQMGLSSFQFFVKLFFSARMRYGCSMSSKVIDFGTNRKRV